MYYYCIEYRYLSDETNCGVRPCFMLLPVTSQSTTDKSLALKWFDNAVKSACKSWNGNKLVYVKEIPLDYRCLIKEAKFVCNEAAYLRGEYIIELSCYSHNPCE